MIRRLALAACAVLATTSLASCATFSDNRTAARVGDVELSQDDIDELLGLAPAGQTASTDPASPDAAGADPLDALGEQTGRVPGDELRAQLSRWIQVALIESQLEGTSEVALGSVEGLDERLDAGLQSLVESNPDGGRELYERGLPETAGVCLGAIPVETPEDAQAALSAIQSGTTFADAAAEFSIDPGLAGNGGVVLDPNGAECFPSTDLHPDILAVLDGLTPGTPAIAQLPGLIAVVQQRPYDDLQDDSRLLLAQYGVATAMLPDLVDSADVYVDPMYGYWDAETASVLPLGG